MAKSKIGSEHAIVRAYDADNEALKVSLLNAEIELSAHDGDSVLAIPETKVITEPGVYDISNVSKISLFDKTPNESTIIVEISPSETEDVWFVIILAINPLDVCAKRLRVNADRPFHIVTKSL